MKAIKISLCFLLIALSATAQQPSKPLTIGDKIPNLIIKGIINQPDDSIAVKDLYKNGLLILNFWATWCGPCLKEMHFLDSLKTKNPDKFNVVMVSNEDKVRVQKFISSNGDIIDKKSGLIIVAEDHLLRQLFPHRAIPHNIWIDRNGIIKAITSMYEITAENILDFENSAKQKTMTMKNENLDFSPAAAFHLGDSTYTYRSIITPKLPVGTAGIYGGSLYSNPKNYFQWNAPIIHLFFSAYSLYNSPESKFVYHAHTLKTNLVEVHTKDSLKIFNPSGQFTKLLKGSKYKNIEDWGKDNLFCYNLTLPKAVSHEQFRAYLFADLQRQFNIRPKIEKRRMKCIVIRRQVKTGQLNLSDHPNGKAAVAWISDRKLAIKNAKISFVANWIFAQYDERYLQDPFLIKVKENDQQYINAVIDFSDELSQATPGVTLNMIYKKLAVFGFQFKPETRAFPKLVLYDLN